MFELIVIGGGPGGYLCAERAAEGGLSTALIEKRALGGTCLNEGCIPTKAMLNSAKLLRHAAESASFGVTAENVKLDHAKVIKRKNQIVKGLVAGVGTTMKSCGVTVIKAEAKILGRVEGGFAVEAGGEKYEARRLVIATGSETAVPPVPGLKEGLESGFVVTNREALDLEALPGSLAVIGGGVIGLEMACYFAAAGVKVEVIEMLDKIAGPTEAEMSDLLLKECTARGVKFHLSAKVLEVKTDALVFEEKGEKQELPCDLVLLSAGRRPATAGVGLEVLGVEMDRAAVVTDDHLCTSVSGVYAIGDCNGKSMLAHTAYREAEVAVNHMLGRPDEMRYNVIPAVIYTDPEVATVGETLESAKAKGMNAREIKLPLRYSGRYMAETERGRGFVKLIVDDGRNRVVGVHMIGSYASEIIVAAAMMVDTELPPERLRKFVFPHPTVGEVIHEALFMI